MKKVTLIQEGHLGFHIVRDDGKSYNGKEQPFKLLETRTINPDRVIMCHYGYHWCATPYEAAIYYDFGPVIEFCLFSPPKDKESCKFVSSSKMVIASADISNLKEKLNRAWYLDRITPKVIAKFNKDVYKILGLTFGRGE